MKRVALCILDGWGMRPAAADNCIDGVAKNWHRMLESYPMIPIQASESFVGLPEGQMGNSEVGHTCIGLGRTIIQDLPKIDFAFAEKTIHKTEQFQKFIKKIKETGGTAHLMGLLSPGGVHSHMNHIIEASELLLAYDIPVTIHAFLDGRDTPPKSAIDYLQTLLEKLGHRAGFKLGTIGGRYYGMDRDKRWDRVEKAHNAIVAGVSENSFMSAIAAVQHYYDQGVTDEFVPPVVLDDYVGMKDGDGLWVMNFRADRMRQILSSMFLNEFTDFPRKKVNFSATLAMNEYADYLVPFLPTIFEKQSLKNSLGEMVSNAGERQLRVAETEKYAHVTFFLNGGVEAPFSNEERVLIQSPKVATYDLQPEMAAREVCDAVVDGMHQQNHGLIVVNFANTDMVGHTGNQDAVRVAVETVDQCLQKIEQAARDNDWVLIITADHGNAEQMLDAENKPYTAHTTNPVPFMLVANEKIVLNEKLSTKDGNIRKPTLADIAPTILALKGINQPEEMTGRSLIM